jgi:hypothetical protein
MWWFLACAPEPGALTFASAPDAPAVVVASFPAPPGVAEVQVVDEDGRERTLPATRRGGRAEAAIVGLPAGSAFTATPLLDGRPGAEVRGQAPAAPDTLPGWSSALDEDPPSTGLLLTVIASDASHVGLVDADGRWRWWWTAPPDRTLSAARPTADGGLLWSSQDRDRADALQLGHLWSWDGSRAREVALTGAHHMVDETVDGELAWLSWDTREVPWLGGEPARVTADRVLTGRGDGDEREVFAWFDDLGPAEVPCGHGTNQIQRGGAPTYEWTHANSLAHEPVRDRLVVNARLTDTILSLDRETGAVAWQLGGPGATLELPPGDAFSHAHFSDVREDRVLVFDNGVHHEPPTTRVREYVVDEDGGRAAVAREVPLDGFYDFLGDARWRDDGGLLVATASPGSVGAWRADGRPVWRLRIDGDAVVGRIWEVELP